jgi:hypothetical protein
MLALSALVAGAGCAVEIPPAEVPAAEAPAAPPAEPAAIPRGDAPAGPSEIGEAMDDDRALALLRAADEDDDAPAPPPHARTPDCGATLTRSVKLHEDVGPCVGDAWTVGADDITIDCDGHTLRGNGVGYGIRVTGRSSVRIRDCKVLDFGIAVALDDVRGAVVQDSRFVGNLELSGVSGVTLARNRVRGSVYVFGTYTLTIAESRITPGFDNDAIATLNSFGLRIRDNRVAGGLAMRDISGARVDDNVLDGGFVLVSGGIGHRLEDNEVRDTPRGFLFEGTRFVRVEDNTVADRGDTPERAAYEIAAGTQRMLLVENEVFDTEEVGFALRSSTSGSVLIENEACGNDPYDAVWEAGSSNNRLLYNDFCTRDGY